MSRTQEKRVMGKVFRDDQGTAAEDIIAVLESEADDYIQVQEAHACCKPENCLLVDHATMRSFANLPHL